WVKSVLEVRVSPVESWWSYQHEAGAFRSTDGEDARFAPVVPGRSGGYGRHRLGRRGRRSGPVSAPGGRRREELLGLLTPRAVRGVDRGRHVDLRACCDISPARSCRSRSRWPREASPCPSRRSPRSLFPRSLFQSPPLPPRASTTRGSRSKRR